MDKFELSLDSSQITRFLECPEKWNNFYKKRLRPVNFQQNEDMNAGTYGHKLLEIYYKMRARNCPHDAILNALDAYKPEGDLCECGCSREYHIEVKMFNVEECQRCKKCMNFRPREFTLDPKTRGKVRAALRMYIEKYEIQGDIIPLSEHHIEVGFSEKFYEDAENRFAIEGRIDLYGKKMPEGLDCIEDHKFQGRASLLYPKSVQFKNYLLASGMSTLFINYIRLHDKKDSDSISREVVTMNSVQKALWRQQLIQVFFNIKRNILAKSYDHNWNECSGHSYTADRTKLKYCWYCDLCEEPDPQVRANKERALYKIEENPWRPW